VVRHALLVPDAVLGRRYTVQSEERDWRVLHVQIDRPGYLDDEDILALVLPCSNLPEGNVVLFRPVAWDALPGGVPDLSNERFNLSIPFSGLLDAGSVLDLLLAASEWFGRVEYRASGPMADVLLELIENAVVNINRRVRS